MLTWVFWIPAGLLSASNSGIIVSILHYAGGAAPLVVTLILLCFYHTPQERTKYWQRLFGLKRISTFWLMIVLFTIPLLTGLSASIDWLFGGLGIIPGTIERFISSPLSIIPFASFLFFFGPLPEEMVWRGYALYYLQKNRSALSSSIILGIYWIVWHLPLFLIPGSYQSSLGIGTPQFWLFILDKIPLTILLTWIVNNTQESTFSAVLFHFMVNFIGEVLDLTQCAEVIYTVLLWFMAVIVVIICKPDQFVLNVKNSNMSDIQLGE